MWIIVILHHVSCHMTLTSLSFPPVCDPEDPPHLHPWLSTDPPFALLPNPLLY